MPTISAFIIAKNEEARIETALKSLVSFCDEIVLVDTGSTDRTKETALHYTDKIFDFAWIDDFSAARNFALSKCTGDWIVFLDADDEITPEHQLRLKQLIEKADKEAAGFLVTYRYGPSTRQLMPRVFRRDLGLKFVMPVHEYLDIPEDLRSRFETRPEVEILHHKEATDNAPAMARNITILKKALAGEPDNVHLQFFLGREYFNSGEYEQALQILQELFTSESIADSSFRFNLALYIGRTYARLERHKEAVEFFQKAHELDGRFAEPLIYAADAQLYGLQDPDAARKLYEEALKVPLPKTTLPVNPRFYNKNPKNQLAKLKRLNRPMALVCGYYGQDNIGDELMLESLIQNLPQFRVVVTSYDPARTQKLHNIEAVAHKDEHFEAAMHQAELVVIGGGTLFHDQGLEESSTIAYYCSIIEQAHRLQKRIVLVGIGVDEVHLQKNRDLIAQNFPYCEQIVVRDGDSKKRLERYGVASSSIEVLPDLSFGLDVDVPKKQSTRERPLVGINLCPPQKNDPHDVQKNIEELLVPFLRENADTYDFIFIPGKKDDLRMAALIEKSSGVALRRFEPSTQGYFHDYFQVVGSCDAFIASRYHMALLGLIARVPTYVLSYADKTEALLKDFGASLKRFSGQVKKEGADFDVDPLREQVRKLLKSL